MALAARHAGREREAWDLPTAHGPRHPGHLQLHVLAGQQHLRRLRRCERVELQQVSENLTRTWTRVEHESTRSGNMHERLEKVEAHIANLALGGFLPCEDPSCAKCRAI